MRILICILTLFMISACSKYKSEIEDYGISGDYEWYYSLDGPVNSISYEQSENQFGIRLKESGKVSFYENGELLDRYKIVDLEKYETTDDIKVTYKIDKFKRGELIFDGKDLVHSDWPFESMTNKFLKVSE